MVIGDKRFIYMFELSIYLNVRVKSCLKKYMVFVGFLCLVK